jgi:hypothetical protein
VLPLCYAWQGGLNNSLDGALGRPDPRRQLLLLQLQLQLRLGLRLRLRLRLRLQLLLSDWGCQSLLLRRVLSVAAARRQWRWRPVPFCSCLVTHTCAVLVVAVAVNHISRPSQPRQPGRLFLPRGCCQMRLLLAF